MIEFVNVDFGYKKSAVISDLSFKANNSDLIVIKGASGAGKTTLLRLIMGLEKPKYGTITIPEGTRFSVVFQESRLIYGRTVLENVALFSDIQTAKDMLCKLRLEDSFDSDVASLSGGMKRRVALARALAHPFDVLILDEAFNGLDEENIQSAVKLIDMVSAGKTVFVITHHEDELRYFSREPLYIEL